MVHSQQDRTVIHAKNAVHFGAGNMYGYSATFLEPSKLTSTHHSGRGFIGPLLSQSGYHVTFVDVREDVIDELNKEPHYKVHVLDANNEQDDEKITDVSGSTPNETSTLDAIADADIVTTSVGPDVLKKIAGTIAEGISKRREKGELTVIACENMIGATSQLKDYVVDAFKSEDKLALLQNVGFPNCEVDRIVPAFEGKNNLDVGVEGFYEWIVEKSGVKGTLDIKGMQLQDSLQPFLERKLYTLNCGHAMLAFLGYIKGYKTIAEAVADEECKETTRKALYESGAGLIRRHGFDEKDHRDYIERTMMRFANPNIKDELARVSRNPLRKLAPNERLVGAVNMCREFELGRAHLIKGIAAAFYFDVEEDEEAVQLVRLVKEKGIESAIEETTSFEKGSQDHRDVLKEYYQLRKN
ncbi:mannitol dehydrogenase domain-containing protein [Mucidula mucida]|nr:mannitol dehydrogenase domain-containing protein [Mucidula mucida]